MKLGCRDIKLSVSRSSSRVSPRAGATNRRGVDGPFSGSKSSPDDPRNGVDGKGVPGRGDAVEPLLGECVLLVLGGTSRSTVNVKNNSC